MPTFFHLSDLHFGSRLAPHLDEVILGEINKQSPDAVVISGDFTLRARFGEYESARAFLSRIKRPVLTIPGNHDQPLMAPFERLTTPYKRYSKYICSTLDSSLAVDGLFFVGLSDCHPIFPGGFWSQTQRKFIEEQLSSANPGAARIIVSHHQFNWDGKWRPAGFWYPTRTLEWLARQGVEIMLNGHTHVPTAELTPQGIVVARAGTATSARVRHGWGNAYNVVELDKTRISISIRQYEERADAYVEAQVMRFPRSKHSN